MKNLAVKIRFFSSCFFILVFSLFIIGCSQKKISGDYYIQQFTEGPTTYYIQKKYDNSAGGVFDGIVTKIAWKGDYLIAEVTRLASCDPSGWYHLNLNTGVIKYISPPEISEFTVVQAELFFNNPKKYKK